MPTVPVLGRQGPLHERAHSVRPSNNRMELTGASRRPPGQSWRRPPRAHSRTGARSSSAVFDGHRGDHGSALQPLAQGTMTTVPSRSSRHALWSAIIAATLAAASATLLWRAFPSAETFDQARQQGPFGVFGVACEASHLLLWVGAAVFPTSLIGLAFGVASVVRREARAFLALGALVANTTLVSLAALIWWQQREDLSCFWLK